MCNHICSVTPPYLLQGIASSIHNAPEIRAAAEKCLLHQQHLMRVRFSVISTLTDPRPVGNASGTARPHQIVPEHLLEGIANSEANPADVRARAARDAEHAGQRSRRYLLLQRQSREQGLVGDADAMTKGGSLVLRRAVYDMNHTADDTTLPGALLRDEGSSAVADKAANEVFDNVKVVLEMYEEKFQWNSLDNHDMRVICSVHFGDQYENAYWDPMRRQMVFGDGGHFLYNFTTAIDVIGHELTHAVTEYTSPLEYYGQSGALNEHVSDVFGVMAKQYLEQKTAAEADWLIGESCLMPGVKGVALRSMKAPGTAYNDKQFGKDPQPDHFDGYDAHDYADNGGVHKYSGIPNKAFYLAAVAFGGYSWDKAGLIWRGAMTSGKVTPNCTFSSFASITIAVAQDKFGTKAAQIVTDAWTKVGVPL
ncbi:metalloprotease [Microdochium bolleyi]|uniref:Metalloprotease n=1 Tax=Microdochium bolleyi TaxID=196109 RepID=A0A136IKI4_9PEZI|nr:metalloprotease [Microdochium bolleyi]